MATDFELPSDQTLTFPERCLSCGKPKETEVTMKVSRLVMVKNKQVQKSASMTLPLCEPCRKADQRVTLISLFALLAGFIIVAVATFLLIARWDAQTGILTNLGVDNVPGQAGGWLIIVGSIAFIAGLIGGFLFEAVFKMLLIPVMGRVLYYAPFVAVQMFGDVEYTAGLRASLSKDASTLRLRFFNHEVAGEFKTLNRL